MDDIPVSYKTLEQVRRAISLMQAVERSLEKDMGRNPERDLQTRLAEKNLRDPQNLFDVEAQHDPA